MKKLLFVLFIAVFLLAEGKPAEHHKFILLYKADEGCEPYVMYPEGGCPHYYAIHAEWFDSRGQAIRRLNKKTAVGNTILWGSYEDKLRGADDVIGLYAVESVPIKFAETGKTFETYESVQQKVTKPEMAWK